MTMTLTLFGIPDGISFSPVDADSGVPQGIVLGLIILFTYQRSAMNRFFKT